MRLPLFVVLLLVAACKPSGAAGAVLGDDESLVFESPSLCKAVISGDASLCETPDCRAILGDNALVCTTGDCAAMIQHDPTKCTNTDCEALAKNDYADGKRTFTASPGECSSTNCKALVRGQAGLCTRR